MHHLAPIVIKKDCILAYKYTQYRRYLATQPEQIMLVCDWAEYNEGYGGGGVLVGGSLVGPGGWVGGWLGVVADDPDVSEDAGGGVTVGLSLIHI